MKFTALLIATMSSVVSGAGHIAAGQDLVNVGWSLPYEGPKTVALKVGDTISFSWNIGHNVYIHPTMNCGLDGAIFVGDTSTTEYTFTDADDGKDIFFSCDIGNGAHCQNGQSLIVTVGGEGLVLDTGDMTTDMEDMKTDMENNMEDMTSDMEDMKTDMQKDMEDMDHSDMDHSDMDHSAMDDSGSSATGPYGSSASSASSATGPSMIAAAAAAAL